MAPTAKLLFVQPAASSPDRDIRCLARWVGALRRPACLVALHPHPGHLPGDATHECGTRGNTLPGSASAMAEGAATTAAPSRERKSPLLELGQPPHPTCATRQPTGGGGARKGYTRSAFYRCGAVHASPGGRGTGTRPGSCCHVP